MDIEAESFKVQIRFRNWKDIIKAYTDLKPWESRKHLLGEKATFNLQTQLTISFNPPSDGYCGYWLLLHILAPQKAQTRDNLLDLLNALQEKLPRNGYVKTASALPDPTITRTRLAGTITALDREDPTLPSTFWLSSEMLPLLLDKYAYWQRTSEDKYALQKTSSSKRSCTFSIQEIHSTLQHPAHIACSDNHWYLLSTPLFDTDNLLLRTDAHLSNVIGSYF